MAMAKALGGAVGAYYKPAVGKIVLRSPTVKRVSQAVIAQNRVFADRLRGKRIASACKGKKWPAFKSCLRTEGTKAYRG